jgi:hypothetical protein
MLYTIETSSGFVKAIKTLGGELNGIAEYTNDRSQAKTFTKKSLTALRARSFFKYYSMTIIIAEV